ncbi:MAG: DUF2155 domain-containing protein [Bradyrhizobiaceae bacterium]|nr:DUF2155 domain-containing protein [Bradyrhizobiaceae bacterium]
MRRILFLATLVGLVVSQPLLAQQRNPWGDLLSPREMYPPQQQQRAPQQPQRPDDDVQSAPLPPPGSGQQQGVPDIALPPQQRQGQPAQKGTPAAKQPAEVTVERPPEQKIANPTAVFSGLDKITGRIFPFEVALNETVQFGALQVTPRACYTRPPTEPQNTTGFIEVDEITLENKMRRIFSGWMFAASPGLNAVEHAIYDVWLVDCKQGPPDVGKTAKQ